MMILDLALRFLFYFYSQRIEYLCRMEHKNQKFSKKISTEIENIDLRIVFGTFSISYTIEGIELNQMFFSIQIKRRKLKLVVCVIDEHSN